MLCFFAAMSGLLHAGDVEEVSIQETVSNLDRAQAFYTGVLQFTSDRKNSVAGGTTCALHLGEETLVLFAPSIVGRVIPASMASNDIHFQHLAIVVSDMDAAYHRLVQNGVSFVSSAPQTLPEWNFDSAQIRALYFRDPDGHFLELIQFPSNKGEPKWQRRGGPLFLGIDHTAIVVRQMKRSRDFYRDVIGLTDEGESLNYGVEQERLSGVLGARVKITSFRGVKGPGIELLQYVGPGLQDILAGDPAPDDLLHWQINLRASSLLAPKAIRDPRRTRAFHYPWSRFRKPWLYA